MIIRPATPADLPAIAALHGENWRRDYGHILSPKVLGEPLDVYLGLRWQPEALADGAHIVLRDVSGLAGFAALDPDHPDGLELRNLHVRIGRRGFGYGRALMGTVARFAASRTLWLQVLEDNVAARAIYRGWGGEEGPVFWDAMLGREIPARRVTWSNPGALAARFGVRGVP